MTPADRCQHCGRRFDLFGRCRRKACPGFNPLWAGDWLSVYLRNLEVLDDLALVTITAPGVDYGMAWDESQCKLPPGHRHSGPNGCKVHRWVAGNWNRSAPERFSRLHRRAAARTRRRYGPGPLLAAKGLEYQQRGLLHFHIVLDWSLPQRARSQHYVDQLKELAGSEMFGSVDVSERDPKKRGERIAFYLSKYVGKAAAEMAQLRRPAAVGRHLTQQTGVTMRAARLKRFAHVIARRACVMDDELSSLTDYVWGVLREGGDLDALLSSLRLSLPPPSVP